MMLVLFTVGGQGWLAVGVRVVVEVEVRVGVNVGVEAGVMLRLGLSWV